MKNNNGKTTLKSVDFDPFADGGLDSTVPSTESQREVWAAVQMGDDASCAYNESISLILKGALDVDALAIALQGLVARHEALCATFSVDGATLCINQAPKFSLAKQDLGHLPEAERRRRLESILLADVETPFDLEHGPLFRATLVKLGAEDHQLILCAHHVICDGLSWETLLPDLAVLYAGSEVEMRPAVRFSDYARFLISSEQLEKVAADEAYWLQLFSTLPPALDLPTDRPRPKMKTYVGDRFDWAMQPEVVAGLKKVGAKNGCTFVAALMAAFNAYLYRITGQQDVVVGLMSAGNAACGFENMVGHSVNLLPVRTFIDGKKSFVELLGAVRGSIFDASEHQHLGFGRLLKKLPLARDPGRIPLVPVTFNIDQAMAPFSMGGVRAEVVLNPRRFENFELSLNASESQGNRVVLECTYNRDLFDAETIENRMAEFEMLISSIVSNPGQAVDLLPLLPERELSRLAQWNATDVESSSFLIHECVGSQVDTNTAVVCGSDEMSYAGLEQKANQLARHLISLGVGPDVLVGLCVDRSFDMLVAMLGILKAGGAYVPLDPGYPVERLRYMMADAKAPVLVTQERFKHLLNLTDVKQVSLDGDVAALIESQDTSCPETSVAPSNLAYVIYTSGSTGKPKGVAVTHASVSNFLTSMAKRPGLSSTDAVLAVTTLSFDIAVLELWLPLTQGARIVLASQEVASDAVELMKLIERSEATLMQATPATWHMLLAAGWTGAPGLKALSGGEALSLDLAKSLRAKVASLWNMYGPTETTVWSSCDEIFSAGDDVTVGRPIDNTHLYVLDDNLLKMPIGVPGELYIGGAGVVRGYLNRPELTLERFIDSPFQSGERLYRTGDLVRWHSDGRLGYIRRLDDQVKVRGFRIELGEIESVLVAHKSVEQAVVVVREVAPGDERLVAFIVSTGNPPESSELRNHLRLILPAYMVPQHYLVLESLPRTPNGKIDRNALPGFDVGVNQAAYIAPGTEVEASLVAIWQDVLNMESVGVQDNFFDLGGHSILATRVLARVRQQYDLVLPLRHFFDAPVIAAMAKEIDALLSLKTGGCVSDDEGDREELEF